MRFDGWCAAHGIDPEEMEDPRYLNLAYWWAVRNASEQADLDKFDRQLWLPPAGLQKEIPKESPWSAQNETAAFSAFSAQFEAMGK